MRKKVLLLFLAFAGVLGLVACGETGQELTSIDFVGIADVEIENGSTFNFFDGVTAIGNNEEDFTDSIVITSTSDAVNTETGALDTLQSGVHAVRYEVTYEGITARLFRYVTVKPPVVAEGEMLVNPTLDTGTSGWDDPSVIYIAEGAAMTLSNDAGTLKAEVTPGAQFYTPRFGQMGIPFENGKTYEVSFEAKSTVEKEIALQVGELLPAAPWFNDFLPAAENVLYRTITTEWATYSYKFTMTQDNQDGGILFGLGKVGDASIAATLHFDNFNIEESTPDADTTGPVLSGVGDVEVLIGATFDPLAGVTALDVTDGDVTANIAVEIKDAADAVVTAVDTSAEAVFTVTYTVSDSLSNSTSVTRTVTIIAEAADPVWIGYGVAAAIRTTVSYADVGGYESNVQLPILDFDGTQTTATFAYQGESGQEYLFKIEGPSGANAVEQRVTADGTLQTVALDLSGLTEAQRDGLSLAVVFAMSWPATGTLHLYGVEEALVSEAWIAYGMTIASVANVFDFPNPDPNAWWNNNVQLAILAFDGDNDSATFNFMGTSGVTYVLKIEGPNGVNVEREVVATGAAQEYVMDLSGLTSAQRATLNLVILFDKNSTAESILELYSLEYSVSQEPDWIGYNVALSDRTLVDYSGTPTEWWNNNVQLPLDAFDGTQTTATFPFIGVAGQEYVFKVEGGGKFVEETHAADGTLQSIVMDLTSLTEAERDALVLAVVFAKTTDGAGTMEVFDVTEATVTKAWTAYGMTIRMVKTMTFPAAPGEWWTNNAQLAVLAFDGENDTVTFNFMGDQGVTYVFKIEGPGGVNVEQRTVGTGDMQSFSLDLSGLTPVQRATLNLIIVFNEDSTAETVLDLYSVEYSKAAE